MAYEIYCDVFIKFMDGEKYSVFHKIRQSLLLGNIQDFMSTTTINLFQSDRIELLHI